jgi:TetR/AcrR family transcriptional regulator
MSSTEPTANHDLAPSEQDARTRSRLIRAAVQVFDKKGYDAASVREIVELAGVTKPALYYHFGSKEGLLKAILTEGAREFDAAMAQAVARPGSTRERIIGLCEDLYGLFSQNLSFIRVTHAVFLGPTEIAPDFDFGVYERSIVGALERIARDGQAIGEVTAVRASDVAMAVLGVVGAVAGRQLHTRMEPIGLDGLRRLLNLVFDGVLRDGSNSHAPGEERQ